MTVLQRDVMESRKDCRILCFHWGLITGWRCDDVTLKPQLQDKKGKTYATESYDLDEEMVTFLVPKCGMYALNLHLGENHLVQVDEVKVWTREEKLVQSGKALLSAELAFQDHSCLRGLNEEGKMRLECGHTTRTQLDLNKTVVFANLFPNRTYSCSLMTSSHHIIQKIEFSTGGIPAPIFLYHEQRIWMIDNQPIFVTNHPTINSTVHVTNLHTNVTHEGPALKAMTEGIACEEDNSLFRVCLIMKQKDVCSMWGCLKSKQCFEVTTIPHLAHLKKNLSFSNSNLTALFGVAVLLAAALVVVVSLFVLQCKHTRTSEEAEDALEEPSISYRRLLEKSENNNF